MRRRRTTMVSAIALVLVIGGCSASGEEVAALDGPVDLRTASGSSSSWRPASAGREWVANVAFDICVKGGGEAIVRTLEVNGSPARSGGPVTGYLHVNDEAGASGFMALTGDPQRLFREYGGTATPIDGARLDRPCPRTSPGFAQLVMSIAVPPEGFAIRTYGITYEIDGTSYRATNDEWTYVACGTEQPREMCSGVAK